MIENVSQMVITELSNGKTIISVNRESGEKLDFCHIRPLKVVDAEKELKKEIAGLKETIGMLHKKIWRQQRYIA